MTGTHELILDIVNRARLGNLKSQRWLAAGFISNAYEFTTDKGEFVLLQNKPTAAHSSDYRSYYANLKVVEAIGYKHAPRAIYLSQDDNSLVITKATGRSAVNLSDLRDVDQQQVAFNITDAMRQLSDVRKQDVDTIYASLGLPTAQILSEDDDWKIYVLDRFEPYKYIAPADARTEWIEVAMADHQKRPHYSGICFHHGDTSPQNILVADDLSVTLIDWGVSGFYESSPEIEDYGLSYAFNRVSVMRKNREAILRRVCPQDYETYERRVYQRSKDIKIADVVWAYWMYCQTSNGNINEPPEKYKLILDQRISEFEEQFS